MPYVESTIGTYSDGLITVAADSATVTGTGTYWLDIVNPGDIFTLDDSTLYFVQSVESNGQLTLDKPFRGPSVTGAAYRIVLNTAAHFPSDTAAKVEKALENLLKLDALAIPTGEIDDLFNEGGAY